MPHLLSRKGTNCYTHNNVGRDMYKSRIPIHPVFSLSRNPALYHRPKIRYTKSELFQGSWLYIHKELSLLESQRKQLKNISNYPKKCYLSLLSWTESNCCTPVSGALATMGTDSDVFAHDVSGPLLNLWFYPLFTVEIET